MRIIYYIGIDGGGTKSRLIAVDESQTVLGQNESGSTNLASNTGSEVFRELDSLFTGFFDKTGLTPDDCAGLCMGSAGIDYPGNKRLMEELIAKCGFTCPITVVNDSRIVLAAATGGGKGPCAVVVSGTGSIALGMDEDGESVRCGGWGHLLDDMGSAYWMGIEGIRRALRSYDGRCQKTVLEKSLPIAMGLNHITECLEPVYGGKLGKQEIAKLAPMVTAGAMAGDKACTEILETSAGELFLLADATIRKLKVAPDVVTVSGGTIVNSEIYLAKLREIMSRERPGVRVETIREEPIMGAVFLARKKS